MASGRKGDTKTNLEHLESDNVRGEKMGKFCHRLLSAGALTLEATLSTAATIPFGWMCLSSAPRSHALCVLARQRHFRYAIC